MYLLVKTILGATGFLLVWIQEKFPELPGSSRMGAEHTTHGFEVGAVVHLHDHIPQVPEGRTFTLCGARGTGTLPIDDGWDCV